MVYDEICVRETLFTIYTKKKVAINMHNLAVSEVFGGRYYVSDMKKSSTMFFMFDFWSVGFFEFLFARNKVIDSRFVKEKIKLGGFTSLWSTKEMEIHPGKF